MTREPESSLSRQCKARAIAFYLPQFHPIPENDSWWGAGFTEWTNVAKAKPIFRRHHQPRTPSELGFYDLRLPETRAAQAELAQEAGIEGFCYWHYWFAGKRLLERPFNEVLASGEPDFPFCLAWANQTWSGIWHGAPNRILIEQSYPGPEDHERHFETLLPAFRDSRYICVRNRPLFLIHRPTEFPDLPAFIEQWQKLAQQAGLEGIHFVAHLLPQDECDWEKAGFAGATSVAALKVSSMSIVKLIKRRAAEMVRGRGEGVSLGEHVCAVGRILHYTVRRVWEKITGMTRPIYHYKDAMLFFLDGVRHRANSYPCLVPNWDNSPRSGLRGQVIIGSTPALFARHVRAAVQLVRERAFEDRILFVKSWNEWAEGNYLEPDLKFGRQYLEALRGELLGSEADREAAENSAATSIAPELSCTR
ncbi:MAG: glycoside hydrolase family 99-like domain-containing protein [Chthoniobacterales bacterium]